MQQTDTARATLASLLGLAALTCPSVGEAQRTGRSAQPPSAWADSQLSAGASANWDFFDDSYRLSSATLATLDVGLSLRPRYRFHRMFQVRAQWGVGMEITSSDTTTTQREIEVSDPVLALWFDGIPKAGDVRFSLAASVAAPVSARSRAATMILATGLLAQAFWETRAFGGTFRALGHLGWVHAFHEHTTPGVRGTPSYARATVGGGASAQLSGRPNVRDQLSWDITLTQSWGAWSPGVSFGTFHQWAYALPTVSASGSATGVIDGGPSAYTSFAAWLDVSPNAWLTMEVGYTLARPLLDGDGTTGNPFYSRYHDWRLVLVANVVLDRLADVIGGRPRAERGIVRW